MTFWQLDPNDRLKKWRLFRNSLSELSLNEVISEVINFWKMSPVGRRVLDVDNSNNWPNPWDLIHKGDMDENSVALGMAYTLHLVGYPCKIMLVQNRKDHYFGLIVLVDEMFVLNYTYGNIDKIDILKDFDILAEVHTEDLIN